MGCKNIWFHLYQIHYIETYVETIFSWKLRRSRSLEICQFSIQIFNQFFFLYNKISNKTLPVITQFITFEIKL